MTSLYWRIFLSFWLALCLILVGTVLVVVNNDQQQRFSRVWFQRAEMYAQATQAFETGGAAALRDWLIRAKADSTADIYVTDHTGREMLGRSIPDYLRQPLESFSSIGRPAIMRAATAPLVLVGPDARTYHVMIGPLRAGPHLFGELEMPTVSIATLFIALVVSAVVCFFLARYLVSPVDQLRRATRQISSGNLDVRVSEKLKGRQDELGLLASDLDMMSERVRNLLESKQQLLRDVSHELRSPLARLQLALSLARRHDNSSVERHLVRIACEADRLEELIARTLNLARLERPAQGLERSALNIGELLEVIVGDVGIEADARSCAIELSIATTLSVNGDRELLRSAFENVIRNALRYGPCGSRVLIDARCDDAKNIEVIVRDSGPGVPEKDLQLIFEPFYRVDAARNRAVGGDGLGLAIAARAVAIHGGKIEARNLDVGGLAVHITVPAAEAAARPVSIELASHPGGAAQQAAVAQSDHDISHADMPSV